MANTVSNGKLNLVVSNIEQHLAEGLEETRQAHSVGFLEGTLHSRCHWLNLGCNLPVQSSSHQPSPFFLGGRSEQLNLSWRAEKRADL